MKIRRILSVFLLTALLLSLLVPTAYAKTPSIKIAAKAALLVDEESGLVLHAQNENDKLYPASITKVMTALLVFEAIDRGEMKMDQKITVSASSLAGLPEDGSSADIKAGEVLTVEQLLYCMLVVSANEACHILGDQIAGSTDAFVKLMNQRAQELGCKNTHFVNPSGLHDPQHYTSAWDIYLFTREAMKHADFMTICGSKSYIVPKTNKSDERELHSTNYLISNWRALGYLYDGAEGIKTGSTDDAGYCLVASAVRGDRRLISVVLGAKEVGEQVQSFSETSRLFDYGFDNFQTQTVLTKDDMVCQVPVELSKVTNYVVVHPAQDAAALLPKDAKLEDVEQTVKLDSEVAYAPITTGDKLGSVTISYNGNECVTVPLLAQYDVPASRFLTAKHDIKVFFSRTIVKVALVVLVVLAIALFVWLRFFHRDRRYGRRSKRYHQRTYRGRWRR
ncbi:MAG: D-alanyl-D-alanine carboxypeptidase [Clostridiales bacterium]|nr:D-alanyl-D-alanine carboxypeptidase [Candidatus Cacconaster stercorequi]